MRFIETFLHTKNPNIQRLSNIGVATFGRGISDKNEERTPHYEIEQCMSMFETQPLVNSALNQLALYLIPNRHIKISSKDEKTKRFLEDWHKQRKRVIDEMRNVLITNMMCGNGPMEKSYADTTNGQKVLDNVFSANNMARVYVNPDDPDGDTAYIFELDVGINSFKYMGAWHTPTHYPITYVKNFNWMRKMVWGIAIPHWKFSIYMSGWSRDNLYGRGELASAIDANNVLNEIVSSWDTIARTRQIDQKILTPVDAEASINVDQKQLDKLGEQLDDNTKSYTMFNTPLKFLQYDIKTSQNYDLMEGVFDLLRRMIMMSLLPQHLTPWSDSATTQGSDSAMPSFLGRIKAKQNDFVKFLNEEIIDELRKTYTWLAEDASYVFDEPKILADADYITMVGDMISSEILSPYQGKLYLTELGILDEDIVNVVEEEEDQKVDQGKDVFSRGENFHKPMTEAATIKANVKFPTFLQRLKQRNPKIDTTGWKELEYGNVGGKDIRLVKHENTVLLFDGTRMINSFDLDVVEMPTIKQASKDYKQKLKDMQQEFQDGDSNTDKHIDELDAQMKKVIDGQLQQFFKALDKARVKREGFTEDFTNPNIINRMGDFFKDFGSNMNKAVGVAMTKLGVSVIKGDDDPEPEVTLNSNHKKLLKKKQNLMRDNIKQQMKATKDKMLVDMKKQVSDGIAAGKPHDQIKKEVEKNFNYDDGVGWKFRRLARTTTRNASAILKLKKLQLHGYENFEWISREDKKTRPAHAAKNHKIFNIEEALNAPADDYDAHPSKAANCRCMLFGYD